MKISMMLAIGKNGELGKDNKLLWHIPEELKNFQKLTKGKYLFMGRNTFDSILYYNKKPLQDRISIVLTSPLINSKLSPPTNLIPSESVILISNN